MAAGCPRHASIALHRCSTGFGHRGGHLVRTGLAWLALAVVACHPALLHAQSAPGTTGTVALSSQLVDRGLAITPATPVVQAAASWTSSTGWSVGLSGSAEARAPGRIAQALLQGARHWSLSADWQMQAGLLYYRYGGSIRSAMHDRGELGVHWLYRDTLAFGLSASRVIGSGDRRTRAAADLDVHWPLSEHAFLSAGVGVARVPPARYRRYRYYRHYDRDGYYRYGQVGLMWAHGPWRLELDRVMTDLGSWRSGGYVKAQPWMATISRSF